MTTPPKTIIYMLWWTGKNKTLQQFTDKILIAVEYYVKKYNMLPDLIEVNIADLLGSELKTIKFSNKYIPVEVSEDVTINSIFVGKEA